MKPSEIKMTQLGDGQIRIDCTFDADGMKNALRTSHRMLAYTYEVDSRSDDDIPGMLAEKLGSRFEETLIQSTTAILAPFVIDSLDFFTIFDYEVLDAEKLVPGACFSFSLLVARMPEYELSSYEPVHIERSKEKLSEEEVEGYLVAIAEEHACYSELGLDDAAKPGDRIVFDIETNREFGPVYNLTGKGKDAILGKGWLTEEFDKTLLGAKLGQTKRFQFEALTESSQDEKDTETFYSKVVVRQIFRPEPIELTDEWVQSNIDVDGVETLADLRSMIERETLRQAEETSIEQRNTLLAAADELASRLDISLSDKLYERAVNELLAQIDQQAQARGTSFDDHLVEMGIDRESLGDFVMKQAKDQLLQGFALDAWFRHFGLSITDADINEAIGDSIASNSSDAVRSQRNQLEMSGHAYVARLLAQRLKANKSVLETAIIDYV